MNDAHFLKICERYQLGELIGVPVLIHRGLFNLIWKINTHKGCFVIKEIKSQQIRNPQDYINAEIIAAIMMKNNIPAITALTIASGSLQITDGIKILVFKWVNGKTLSLEPATVQQANIMGKIFAKMHLLNIQIPELTESTHHYVGQEKWQQLIKKVTEKNLAIADQLRLNIDKLLSWENLYQSSRLKCEHHELISHRDLNPKNTIWINATTPIIIDWEWAGLVNPTMEMLSAAYEWSGLIVEKFEAQTFAAFLHGYYQGGAKMTVNPSDALHNSLGKWLDWFAFIIDLICQDQSPSEINFAINEAEKTFNLLVNLTHKITAFTNIALGIHKQYY